MIEIQDAEILDILPFTFKTPRYKALSAAIQKMTAKFYETMSAVLFWSDIGSASEKILDAMATELDCPFYTSDLPIEQKRDNVSAAFSYNSRIGSVGAIGEILKAAFGGGEVTEWFQYGGKPYHFKLRLPVEFGDLYVSAAVIENFYKILEKAKNKRSKLDELVIEVIAQNIIKINIKPALRRNRTIIQSLD